MINNEQALWGFVDELITQYTSVRPNIIIRFTGSLFDHILVLKKHIYETMLRTAENSE